MPLIYHRKSPAFSISLWWLTEDIPFFYEMAGRYAEDILRETGKNTLRKKQWLAARHLLHHHHGILQNIAKTPEGKPYCPGTNPFVSLSHSGELIATYSSQIEGGIDVQSFSEQVVKIKDKFVSQQESTEDPLSLHLIWSAKEAMYKSYGLKKLNFKEHLLVVTPEKLCTPSGSLVGQIHTHQLKINYQLEYEIWNKYLLVIAQEQNRIVL